MTQASDIAIIGGGIVGLATALSLMKALRYDPIQFGASPPCRLKSR